MKRTVLVLLAMTAFLSESATLTTAEAKAPTIQKRIITEVALEEPKEQEDGYFYYEVPEEFRNNGGEMPTDLQKYVQDLCTERHISYPLVLAVIERETGYRNIKGDGDSSTGYMQVMQKWHEERMKSLGVTDLSVPEENIAVGIDYLIELFEKYTDVELVLMAYNMGESGAKKLWEQGIYSSRYSSYIVEREAEISLEIYGR